MANRHIWAEFAPQPSGTFPTDFITNDTGGIHAQAVYYVNIDFDSSGNASVGAMGDTDGIQTQDTPIEGSSNSSNVYFQVHYNDSDITHYNALCLTVYRYSTGVYQNACYTGVTQGTNQSFITYLGLYQNSLYHYQWSLNHLTDLSGVITDSNGKTVIYNPATNDMQDWANQLLPSVTFATGVYSAVASNSPNSTSYTSQPCTWSDFNTWGGCLQNISYALFVPTQQSLNQFNDMVTTYKNKPPFGYISAIQTQLASVNDTNTSVFTLQTMPILNTYIFNPLRVAFAWILWLGFTFLLFRRFKDIQL